MSVIFFFALTFALVDQVDSPSGDQIDWRRRRIGPVHIPDQFSKTKFPFGIRVLLDPLIGVAHHSNQQVNENNGCHQKVEGEHCFKQHECPFFYVSADLKMYWSLHSQNGSCAVEDDLLFSTI